jgi:transposase
MRKSRLNNLRQEGLMEHFVSGSMARCASVLVDVNNKSEAYFFNRLREIIYHVNEDNAPLAGVLK